MMPLHFNYQVMLHVLSQRYIQNAMEVREGGTNFTWKVSRVSPWGKISKGSNEERRKEMLCREHKVIPERANSIEQAYSEETNNNGKRKLAFGVKLKPVQTPTLPFISYVILGNEQNLSDAQFYHL